MRKKIWTPGGITPYSATFSRRKSTGWTSDGSAHRLFGHPGPRKRLLARHGRALSRATRAGHTRRGDPLRRKDTRRPRQASCTTEPFHATRACHGQKFARACTRSSHQLWPPPQFLAEGLAARHRVCAPLRRKKPAVAYQAHSPLTIRTRAHLPINFIRKRSARTMRGQVPKVPGCTLLRSGRCRSREDRGRSCSDTSAMASPAEEPH